MAKGKTTISMLEKIEKIFVLLYSDVLILKSMHLKNRLTLNEVHKAVCMTSVTIHPTK